MADPDHPPPVRTGKPPEQISVTGFLLPWFDGQPDLVGILGLGLAVVLFSTREKLEAGRVWMPFNGTATKVITDGGEFLDSVPGSLPIVIDPCQTPEGKVRYLDVKRN